MYEPKDFSSLIGMSGFSDGMLTNHFKLYVGYVTNTNLLLEKLSTLESGTPEYNELSRRFGWEYNGMRLHELYFGNMTKQETTLNTDSKLFARLTKSFGSLDNYTANIMNRAKMRGIGWLVTYYDYSVQTLFNVWIDEHGTNHLTGAAPIMVMDLWEHAFMLDYGLDKKSYIEQFLKHLDYSILETRFANWCI